MVPQSKISRPCVGTVMKSHCVTDRSLQVSLTKKKRKKKGKEQQANPITAQILTLKRACPRPPLTNLPASCRYVALTARPRLIIGPFSRRNFRLLTSLRPFLLLLSPLPSPSPRTPSSSRCPAHGGGDGCVEPGQRRAGGGSRHPGRAAVVQRRRAGDTRGEWAVKMTGKHLSAHQISVILRVTLAVIRYNWFRREKLPGFLCLLNCGKTERSQ